MVVLYLSYAFHPRNYEELRRNGLTVSPTKLSGLVRLSLPRTNAFDGGVPVTSHLRCVRRYLAAHRFWENDDDLVFSRNPCVMSSCIARAAVTWETPSALPSCLAEMHRSPLFEPLNSHPICSHAALAVTDSSCHAEFSEIK